MNAHKFVKQYGWVESKMYLQRSFDVGVYVDPGLKLMIHQSICDPSHSGLEFCFHRNDLKRIVESHELVEKYKNRHGGIRFRIRWGQFRYGDTKDYNDRLKQAIADFKACQ